MGRLRRSRTHHARRDVQRAARTRVRTKDLDQIQKDLDHKTKFEVQPIDEDKPGLGQHYCIECGKYYESDAALRTHSRSKVHKRRLKELKEGAYTVEESQRAAGSGAPDNRQRGVEDVVRRFESGMSTTSAAGEDKPARFVHGASSSSSNAEASSSSSAMASSST